MRLERVVCVGVLNCVLALPAAAVGAPPTADSPADRLTSALVAMGQAQVGDQVLEAWLGQQGDIPRLSGEQLARLKTAGLSNEVLLHLVRGGDVAPSSVGAAPPEQLSSQSPVTAGAAPARVRVLVQSTPAVDYCELALDGTLVATQGRLLQGAVPAGGRVPRAKALALRKPATLFEGEVAPGRHVLHTGFVLSRLQEEFGELRQGRRQRLVAEGVRALPEAEEGEGGTVCSVGPGEVCQVTARFRRVGRALLGGSPTYAVSYDTLVLSERTEAEVQAANWAGDDR